MQVAQYQYIGPEKIAKISKRDYFPMQLFETNYLTDIQYYYLSIITFNLLLQFDETELNQTMKYQ